MFSSGTRRWSGSNTNRMAAAKSYLDTWVGNNSSKGNARTVTCPLLVSGTSYMIATLRLERTDTPESIAKQLRDLAPSVKTLWKCPIVLDLRAWKADGSPHYKAPPAGSLRDMVSTLGGYGLAVVGVNGAPTEFEQEASEKLGLLILRSANQQTTLKCGLDDVFQMVMQKHLEESHPQPSSLDKDINFPKETISANTISLKEDDIEIEKEDCLNVGSTFGLIDSKFSRVALSATIYQGTVRSGQQVSSEKGRSLVILGSVSSGGEVLSDGDILVLGKLRGRALAGLSSDSARIISTYMDPELVSIGGVLSTGDQVIITGGAAMVSLSKQRHLEFVKISIT